MNDPVLGPGFMRIITALPEDNHGILIAFLSLGAFFNQGATRWGLKINLLCV